MKRREIGDFQIWKFREWLQSSYFTKPLLYLYLLFFPALARNVLCLFEIPKLIQKKMKNKRTTAI